MGRASYGDPTVLAYGTGGASVEIGAFCSIGSGTTFLLDAGDHHTDWITTSPEVGKRRVEAHASKGITVGNDVWIGRGAKILGNVSIGSGAVIGAYAVVASDVRPYAVVVGNPATEVRRRFSDTHCEALLASRWWDLSDCEIEVLLPLLWSPDVEGFLKGLEQLRRSPKAFD